MHPGNRHGHGNGSGAQSGSGGFDSCGRRLRRVGISHETGQLGPSAGSLAFGWKQDRVKSCRHRAGCRSCHPGRADRGSRSWIGVAGVLGTTSASVLISGTNSVVMALGSSQIKVYVDVSQPPLTDGSYAVSVDGLIQGVVSAMVTPSSVDAVVQKGP